MKRGCLYCYSGNMDRAIEVFHGFYPDIRLVYPRRMKRKYIRANNTFIDEAIPLLPGYMFFETDKDLPKGKLERTDYLLRLLTYTDGEWQLRGADDRFARMIMNTDGKIGVSKAYFDGNNRMRILDGFLKDYEESIVSVKRKYRTAEICIEFQDRALRMKLDYELMQPMEMSS